MTPADQGIRRSLVAMPVAAGPPDPLDAALRARASGNRVALVTVVDVDGAVASRPGLRLAVTEGEVILAGMLGCSEFDTVGVGIAREALASGSGVLRRRVEVNHGAVGALEFFAEVLEPLAAVFAITDNPIGRSVVDLSSHIGRRAVLLDPRLDGLDPLSWLAAHPPRPHDAVVLCDHDAPYADSALRRALDGDAGYVGILGSRRRAGATVRQLAETGVPEDQLTRLHTPVGLDLGGRTPGEIGLSIVAEIVAWSYDRAGTSMRTGLVER